MSSHPYRTALHLACAFGHPEVVTLLAEKKCQMNFGDNKNRIALMKVCGSQLCQHEIDLILVFRVKMNLSQLTITNGGNLWNAYFEFP